MVFVCLGIVVGCNLCSGNFLCLNVNVLDVFKCVNLYVVDDLRDDCGLYSDFGDVIFFYLLGMYDFCFVIEFVVYFFDEVLVYYVFGYGQQWCYDLDDVYCGVVDYF